MSSIITILPPPFEWIAIPGGKVTLDHTGGYLERATTVSVPAFAIARYPITNAQFQVFVDAPDGYQNPQWWDYSEDAREWRSHNAQPKRIEFGDGDHPRTHVTWYEAVAFCRWLSEKTGEGIRLPTEAEWQRAAQGDDGRAYPWGNEWEASRCQSNVSGSNIGTTSVLAHAGKGDSPFGVADMAGNVWEWCLTSWKSGENDVTGADVRVLRGGSWFDDVMSFFHAAARHSWNPDITSDLRGFRVVRAGDPLP